MTKTLVFVLVVLGLVAVAISAQESETAKPDPAKELTMSVARGKALFVDTELGTNGMACNSCHKQGGAVESKLGDKTLKAFDDLASMYPRYWGNGRVMTLDQVVNFCLTNPLQGEALAWDSQELTDLVAYCASVVPMEPKMEKAAE